MRNKRIILKFIVVLMLALTSLVFAAPTAFSLRWWTVDGGGGTSQGGDYVLRSTIGQPDAGHRMSGGDYSLAGGFWTDAALAEVPPSAIYLPLLAR